MLYFKIKTGYEEGDMIYIDETEYSMALRAQINGKIAFFKNGTTIGGNNIISIKPDMVKIIGYELETDTTIPEVREQIKELMENYQTFIQKEKLQIEGRTKLLE